MKHLSTMHTGLVVLALLLTLPTAGCVTSNEEEPDPNVRAFIEIMTTVAIHQIRNDSSVIVTRIQPAFRGKGQLILEAWGRNMGDTMFVFSPVRDTLVNEGTYAGRIGKAGIALNQEFEANRIVEQIWSVILKPAGHAEFSLTTRARMDSVFVPDSNRYFHNSSAEVARYFNLGPNRGFVWVDASYILFP